MIAQGQGNSGIQNKEAIEDKLEIVSNDSLLTPTIIVKADNKNGEKKSASQNVMGRTEFIRRMRRANTIFKTLQGHPSALIAESLLKITKNRQRR